MHRIGKLGKALLFVMLAAFGAGALGVSEEAEAASGAPHVQHHTKAKHKKARRKPAKHAAHKVKHVKPAKHARHKAKRGQAHPIGS